MTEPKDGPGPGDTSAEQRRPPPAPRPAPGEPAPAAPVQQAPSGALPDALAELRADLRAELRASHRHQAAVVRAMLDETLTTVRRDVARVVEETVVANARADALARRDDADSLRAELATVLGALQAAVVDRVGTTSATDAAELRSALGKGFRRVGKDLAVALRGELQEFAAVFTERLASVASDQATSGAVAGAREAGEELRAAVQGDLERVGMRMGDRVDASLESAINAVSEGVARTPEVIRGELDAIRAQVTAAREALLEAATKDRSRRRAELESLRTALDEAVGRHVDELRSGLHDVLRRQLDDLRVGLEDSRRVEAAARAASEHTPSAQLDTLTETVREMTAMQDQLHGLLAQLWGSD